LALLNLRDYFSTLKENQDEFTSSKEEVVKETKSHSKPLKPLRLDVARFEIEVVKPHKDMRAKFPKHPDMVINKLSKLLDKERNKTLTLLEKVSDFKHKLGIQEVKEEKKKSRKRRSLEMCPEISPYLLGPLYVKQKNVPDLDPQGRDFSLHFSENLEVGGAWKPRECLARTKLAVLIPYRNRTEHLRMFLHHMHPIFQRQLLDYRIFVVEQTPKEDFNRGALMNIGYAEALKRDDYDCFVFHDVDLVPEDDRNTYECPISGPKHMSVAVNKWKYRLQYKNYFGGVTALSRQQFKAINGFANSFYGWGGEDDDLNHRIHNRNYTLNRNPANIARFIMLKHDKVSMNEDLENMMEKSANNQLDDEGLNTLKYSVVQSEDLPLYTWILADLPPAPPKKPKSWFDQIRNKAKEAGNYIGGGLAKKVADTAVKFAANRDEEEEEMKDHMY